MKKKILFGFLTLTVLFFACGKVSGYPSSGSVPPVDDGPVTCELMEAIQHPIYGTTSDNDWNSMPFFIFKYNTDNSPDLKKSHFYNQTIQLEDGNEEKAFCINRGKSNGHNYIYRPDDEEYEKVIRKYTGAFTLFGPNGPSKADVAREFSKIILGFDAYWRNQYYDENYMNIQYNPNVSVGRIEKIADMFVQTLAWVWEAGEITEFKARSDGARIILAQAYCGIVLHNDRQTTQEGRDPCTYYPTRKFSPSNVQGIIADLNSNHEYLREAYHAITNGGSNEAMFVYNVWLKGVSNGDIVRMYNATGKRPTVYKPIEEDKQSLLSSYHCIEEVPDPEGCWELEVDIPYVCESDVSTRSGKIADPEAGRPGWGCIFQVSEDREEYDVLKTHYNADETNPYCEVFCREEVKFELPKPGTAAFQGRYMTVGLNNENMENILPIHYIGKKECRVTSEYAGGSYSATANRKCVNSNSSGGADCYGPHSISTGTIAEGTIAYKKFEVDYLEMTVRVNNAWDNYQKWEARKVACGRLDGPKTHSGRCCSSCDSEGNCTPGHPCSTTVVNSEKGEYGIYEVTYGGYIVSSSCHGVTRTPPPCRTIESDVKNAEDEWKRLKELRDTMLYEIKSCISETKMDFTYNTFKPVVKISYDDIAYGDVFDLETVVELVEDESHLYTGGNSTYTNLNGVTEGTFTRTQLVDSTFTPGSLPQFSNLSYEIADWWQSYVIKEADYTLPEEVYRFVEKGTGQSVHSSPSLNRLHYIDMGFPNLPIHYSTAPNEESAGSPRTVTVRRATTTYVPDPANSSGRIPVTTYTQRNVTTRGLYEFYIKTESFGAGNKFNKYIFGNETFATNIYYDRYSDYLCEYMVKCNPMISSNPDCSTPNTGSGLNLVYRTISLKSKKDAFPGIDGTGRIPGSNWSDSDITNYILQNRGETGYDIYTKLDPLYEIYLTPAVMRSVRSYNKQINRTVKTIYEGTDAAKTAIIGYANFEDFECERDTGRNCKSKLLRGAEIGLEVTGCALDTDGRCSDGDEAW